MPKYSLDDIRDMLIDHMPAVHASKILDAIKDKIEDVFQQGYNEGSDECLRGMQESDIGQDA